MGETLIIFVKNPDLGKVKTRLAKSIGEEKALLVYIKLLLKTKKLASSLKMKKVVFYSERIDSDDIWTNSKFEKKLQEGENIGERMHRAIFETIEKGAEKVCLIGSDTPDLSDKIINTAFEQLSHHDVVLGPAKDGGYYLIGLKKPNKTLFSNISWSTEFVLKETMSEIRKLKLRCALLQVLVDIDTFEDLRSWDQDSLLF
jgi:hypothetical protein